MERFARKSIGVLLALAVVWAALVALCQAAPPPTPEQQLILNLQKALSDIAAYQLPAQPAPAPTPGSPATAAPAPPAAIAMPALPAARPYLWPDGTDVAAKLAATPASVWKQVIADAESTAASPERMASAAILYRFGLQPGFTYKKTQADYGAQAASDLVAFDLSAANYKALASHLAHLSVTYDWCHDLLTSAQRTAFVAGAEAWLTAIKNGGTGLPTTPGYEAYWGYNVMPGAEMLLALAIHDDSQADWASDCFANMWVDEASTNSRPHYNLAYHKKVLPLGGNREGAGYYAEDDTVGTMAVELAKFALSAATGNHDADDLNPNRYPLWLLFQTDPNVSKGSPLRCLPTTLYAPSTSQTLPQSLWYYRLGIETANPDPARAGLARWLLDQTLGLGFRSPSTDGLYPFLSYVLIGDPRVAGKSPGDLNVPLTYSTTREVFQRSDWTTQATVLYFGSSDYITRSTPTCEVALWRRGVPLLLQRLQIYGHSYGPGVLRNCAAFYNGTALAGATIGHGGPYNETPVGTFQVGATSWVGECSKIYRNPANLAAVPITLCRRTVTPLPNVTVTDEISCDPALTPHVIWNMPTLPVLSLAGQPVAFTSGQSVQADAITITHATASCTLTFAGPTTMIPIGGTTTDGVIHWVDGLDGQPMDVNGLPAVWTDLVAQAHIDPSYLKLTDAERQMIAGDWRIQIPLPAGGGELTTTIKVQ